LLQRGFIRGKGVAGPAELLVNRPERRQDPRVLGVHRRESLQQQLRLIRTTCFGKLTSLHGNLAVPPLGSPFNPRPGRLPTEVPLHASNDLLFDFLHDSLLSRVNDPGWSWPAPPCRQTAW